LIQAWSTVLDARMISEVFAGDVTDMRVYRCIGEIHILQITEQREFRAIVSLPRASEAGECKTGLMTFSIQLVHTSREAPNTQGSARWPRVDHA
jgi:hypothetical protein